MTDSTLTTHPAVQGEPSPILAQYKAIKAAQPDGVLVIQADRWYHAYGNDAMTLATICRIGWSKTAENDFFATFPRGLLGTMRDRLLADGAKLVVADTITPDDLPDDAEVERVTSSRHLVE